MTSEEKKIFDGVLFKPGDPELRQIKLRSHNLCAKYNRTTEDEVEYRAQLLQQILGGMGKGVRAAYDSFRRAGVRDAELKLYPGLRHEILNEDCRAQVYDDLWEWIERHNG